MPWYAIMLRGGPVVLSELDGAVMQRRTVAFLTTRKAFANTTERAIALAIQDAARELREKGCVPSPMRAEEIWRLTKLQALRRAYRGFVFYPWSDEDESASTIPATSAGG